MEKVAPQHFADSSFQRLGAMNWRQEVVWSMFAEGKEGLVLSFSTFMMWL